MLDPDAALALDRAAPLRSLIPARPAAGEPPAPSPRDGQGVALSLHSAAPVDSPLMLSRKSTGARYR